MKILMLGWELPPNNSGGLGVACLQLSKALAEAGADIEFVLPYAHNETYPFMRINSATKDALPLADIFNAYESYRYYTKAGDPFDIKVTDQQTAYAAMVSKLVDSIEFDVIHAHDWLTFRAALLARQKSSKPLILHIHSIERNRAGGNEGNPLVREIEATAMMMADHVIAVSQRTKNEIVSDYHIPADKIEVVHNSLDPAVFEPLSEINAYHYLASLKQSGYKVVSNVGRLTIQKGLPQLLGTAARVIAKRPKTMFLIVGDGEQRDELIELSASLGIAKNVLFTGFQRGKTWRDAYGISDVFVMPSVSEPFGLTAYEAAAYGVPALISKQSGVAEVFSNCLKVDFWDEKEMANQIIGVLDSQALSSEIGQAARGEFFRLSWAGSAAKIMDRYRAITQGVPA